MLQVAPRALRVLALLLALLMSASIEARQQPDTQPQTQDRPTIRRPIPAEGRRDALPFARTELFFGTAKPDGVVTEQEFRDFVDRYVTPRFPDGLTLLKGDGQFRGEDTVIVKEQSFVLILLYPSDSFNKSSQRIEKIRTLYKDQFAQESVLRVDDPYVVWVSF